MRVSVSVMEMDATDTKGNGARISAPSRPLLVYSSRPDATPETETEVLASIYLYVLQCHEKKKATGADNGEGVRECDHGEEIVIEKRRP